MTGWIADVVTDQVIASTWGNQVRDRTVTPFTNAAARTAAIATPKVGMLTWLDDVKQLQYFDGTAWQLVGPRVLAYTQVTADQAGITNTIVDLTGLTATVTVPALRRIRLTANVMFSKAAPDTSTSVSAYITDAANTVVQQRLAYCPAPGFMSLVAQAMLTPAAGTYTWKVRANTGAGFTNLSAAATFPSFFTVEDVGPF